MSITHCLYLMWSALSLCASSRRPRDCLRKSVLTSTSWARGGILTPTPSVKYSLHSWTPNCMWGAGATWCCDAPAPFTQWTARGCPVRIIKMCPLLCQLGSCHWNVQKINACHRLRPPAGTLVNWLSYRAWVPFSCLCLSKNTFSGPSNLLTVTMSTRLRCPVRLSCLLFLPLLALPRWTPKVSGGGTTGGRPIYLSILIKLSI